MRKSAMERMKRIGVEAVAAAFPEEADRKRLDDLLHRSWEYVSCDVQGVEGWEETPDNVAEVSIDADRLTMIAEDGNPYRPDDHTKDIEVARRFYAICRESTDGKGYDRILGYAMSVLWDA